jgi:hypothetical protein
MNNLLFIRLLELREEYFCGMTNRQVYSFYRTLDTEHEYSSNELIRLMASYVDGL